MTPSSPYKHVDAPALTLYVKQSAEKIFPPIADTI